ncbi:PadR family transcriptional regulator [Treponema phagedenis]|uniref:PadR family transcriptional regulator n=1 Tax=Treponema phagedenis TaxID=162 RepID=A0A0B7GRR5_TREPH|nr:PadR family transcriptional regulator [Treponema phagedenis]NVP25554.1 PadR family transcriptional regulator [Treponema phagedenis]QEJ94098.1 PadR family transcriptional regulator [Treponema phagedenis]QEJ97417.1 PadR family transcriptional regulator [Treponema phagedenis]QEK01891.1 PadR family transcriptional regulator [Treponema phagedenis]QEK02453.1 PadR family transcriptional regulator [Treponema phagedenis]
MLFSINSGLLEACVLALLSREDTYGYKLTQDVKELISISESTLYPVLRRLQVAGFLQTYDVSIDSRNRKYYRITMAGKRQQELYRQEWEDYKKLIDHIFDGGEKHDA